MLLEILINWKENGPQKVYWMSDKAQNFSVDDDQKKWTLLTLYENIFFPYYVLKKSSVALTKRFPTLR